MSGVDAQGIPAVAGQTIVLDAKEEAVLQSVEPYLKDGLLLKRWYEAVLRGGKFQQQFELTRTANRPDRSFGFFDNVQLTAGPTSVMGSYQEMLYDQPGAMADWDKRHRGEWLDQIREFVLRYFLRVTCFSQPVSTISSGYPSPDSYIGGLSWAQPDVKQLEGMGFTQLYAKLKGTGKIVKFSEHEKYAIVDLREAARKYEWILLRVRIFDFRLSVKPLGPDAPEVVTTLNEASYLVLSPEFVIDEGNVPGPDGGKVSRFGFGCAFIKNSERGLTAYGPGEFDAAFESIEFDVDQKGKITARMKFASSRPETVTAVRVNPVKWGFDLANAVSRGWVSRLMPGVDKYLPAFGLGTVDPVKAYIDAANLATGGQAAQMMCISREQLDKRFLLQHFSQHYQTLIGSLMTWRQISNWLDEANLPKWITTGGLIND